MDNILNVLNSDEIIKLKLRSIYEQKGYKMYKMSRFEEYGFYLENKNFLLSNSVITFTDLDGRLLALKPDVTLSIVKHSDGSELKVYYNENVYRPDRNKRSFKEIAQTGLEYIGKLNGEKIGEVVSLAAKSLKTVSENSLLELGHCGFTRGVLNHLCGDAGLVKKLLGLISQKNVSDIKKACVTAGLSDEAAEMLVNIPKLCGPCSEVIKAAEKYCFTNDIKNAVAELDGLCKAVAAESGVCNIRLDLSLVGEEEYYNGVVFCGYVKGIPARVLTGGRYDALLDKLGKRSGAVGFAIYFDELEQLYYNDRGDN